MFGIKPFFSVLLPNTVEGFLPAVQVIMLTHMLHDLIRREVFRNNITFFGGKRLSLFWLSVCCGVYVFIVKKREEYNVNVYRAKKRGSSSRSAPSASHF